MKKLLNLISYVLVAAIVILAIALVGVRVAGYKVFAVLSGSMEPTYPTGSLIYVKETDYRDLKTGDVITFMLNENTVVTHRIVSIVPDENDPGVLRYETKGDNNDVADGGLVHYKNVIGIPVFSIPYLGYVASYIQHPPGTYVAISVCAVIVLLAFLPDLFEDKKTNKEE